MFNDQPRKSPRANFLHYDSGDFFITICTRNRKHYFGSIKNGEMHLSLIGQFVNDQLHNVSQYADNIRIPLFVVMPNHVHFIICIPEAPNNQIDPPQQRIPNPAQRPNFMIQRHVSALSRYISSLKGAVTKFAKAHNLEFAWQPRYHDHFLRRFEDRKNIAYYILNNVANWESDCFFPADTDH